MIALAALSAGVGLARLAWVEGPLPRPFAVGAVTALTLGLVWWLVAGRRAATDRARLTRWTAEALADTRAGLDTAVAGLLLDLDRQCRAALDGLDRRLEEQVTTHHQVVHAARARRRAHPIPQEDA